MADASLPLDGPRRAADGETRALVVFLHGYGADGHDLFGLVDPLGPHLPGVAFHAPHAPEPCRVNPMGRQWFPIPWLDGSPEAEMTRSFAASADALQRYLEAAMAAEGVGPERTALVGFSQGTMMSLHVGPRLAPGLAGIVGFSGRLADPGAIAAAPTRPPVLLVHGDVDEVIPAAEMPKAAEALQAAGYPVATHLSTGIGHGIAPDGLGLALGFLVERLGINQGQPGDKPST